MSKDKIEAMCRKAGLIPQAKRTVKGREVCIADGFSLFPHIAFARAGVKLGEFPSGAFVTMWWLGRQEGMFALGEPIFFDAFHDPHMEQGSKRQARINAALLRAERAIGTMHEESRG